jgi:hypothetical protein
MTDETLKEQIMEIVDITHSNCPYVKPCPVYNQSIRAIQEVLLQDRERAVLTAQIGMIEYYDQVTNNKDMDWKGLFADNRKALEYDLSKLQSPNKREDSDE